MGDLFGLWLYCCGDEIKLSPGLVGKSTATMTFFTESELSQMFHRQFTRTASTASRATSRRTRQACIASKSKMSASPPDDETDKAVASQDSSCGRLPSESLSDPLQSEGEPWEDVAMDTYTFATSRQIKWPVCIKM